MQSIKFTQQMQDQIVESPSNVSTKSNSPEN